MKISMNIQVIEEETNTDFVDKGGISGWLLGRFIGFKFIDDFLSKVEFNSINKFIIMSHGAKELLLVEMFFVHGRL